MIQIKNQQNLSRLRRIALSAQGLQSKQPYGRGYAAAVKAINHLSYVQIDTISVVNRAHHHVLYSRVPGYKPEMLNQMLVDKAIFEYWSHAAAFLPIQDFRFSLPYKHAIKSGQVHWHRAKDDKLMQQLLDRIRAEGPLRSRDLDSETTAKRAGWWDWKPAKKALEQLYMEGDLMVSDRVGFQKSYDLTERVLPSAVDTEMPNDEAFAEHMVEQQLQCHGLVSLRGVTYLRQNVGLRKGVKNLIEARLDEGLLEQVQLSNGEEFVINTGAFEQSLPRLSNRLQILSPFDNSVIQRDRLKALFDYDYKIECYVPAAKRQYGYFSLPLLFRDTFIGRMDCKSHRKTGELEIKSLHFEPHRFDDDAVLAALLAALKEFCQFQNCTSICVSDSAATMIKF